MNADVIEFWIRFSEFMGLPKSTGQVYGLIFQFERALNAEDCVAHLNMSRSSVGQALATLQNIGAIRKVANLDSRKEHYRMETDLGTILRGFMNQKALPTLHLLGRDLATLQTSAQESGDAFLTQRLTKLENWQSKLLPALKLLRKTLK